MNSFNVINGNLFEFHETIRFEQRSFITISFGEIVNYELYKDSLLERVTIKQVIEVSKYLKGEEYLSVERIFERNFPDGVATFINAIRQLNNLPPVR